MGTEAGLVNRLATAVRRERRIALVLGSGLSAGVVPGVAGMLELADEFVARAITHPDLAAALARVRAEIGDRPAETYATYRRTFTEWVSPFEFDIVVQRAVLQAYLPPGAAPPTWERISFQRGEQLERDLESWRVPPGIAALGVILANRPAAFGHRVLTTNFDPLIEIAVRRAGGRARSRLLSGEPEQPEPDEGQIDVIHLHGYWRQTRATEERAPLHDPEQLRDLAELLDDETVCVVGYSGWDDVLTRALSGRAVLWAAHAGEGGAPPSAQVYSYVDSDRLFPSLQRALLPERPPPAPPEPPVPRRPETLLAGGHRHRLPSLERLLGARPSADELLHQLAHEFGWRVEYTPDAPLEVLYWPVQLRPVTLIYAVQALAAAALSARGLRVILCFDDLVAGPHAGELRENFAAEVGRWFALVDGARPPEVESLVSFCDPGWVAQRLQDPELLHRPTHPWAVEREYYGGERTIYDIVRATKAIPDNDPDEASPVEIKRGLTTTDAVRLASTPAIWAYLQYVLRDHAAESVLTLAGDDEATMWRFWHDVFTDRVSHLYNPLLVNVRQDATLLRGRSLRELTERLTRAYELPDWDHEGHYLPWTVQNAVLLAHYLGIRPQRPGPDGLFDSWSVVESALRDDRSRADTIRAIAEEISALMLHDSH